MKNVTTVVVKDSEGHSHGFDAQTYYPFKVDQSNDWVTVRYHDGTVKGLFYKPMRVIIRNEREVEDDYVIVE